MIVSGLDRAVRIARLLRLLAHLMHGCLITGLRLPLHDLPRRRALRQRWSAQLLHVLDVRLEYSGRLPRPGQLLVANHLSWLDVFALNACVPMSFVCKDEVRHWPLLGWLVSRNETVFIERGHRAAAARVRQRLVARLSCGVNVAVFPEGSSTDGSHLLPFKPALFQSAIDAGRTIRPACLRYVDADGKISHAADYHGDISLFESIWTLLGQRGLRVRLEFLPDLAMHGHDRQQLSRQAHQLIATRLSIAPADSVLGISRDPPAAQPSGPPPTDSPNPAPEVSFPF